VKAVVFDCDGVLVDSEPLSEAAWTRALSRYGYELRDGDFDHCLGRTRGDIHAFFAQQHSLPGLAEFSAAVDDEIIPLLESELEAFPDAVEAVQELALNGVPLAVASSSRRRDLDLKLDRVGLRRYFEVSIAGDEVTAGKPAPDLFLGAATGLGVDPTSCLAVEDSPAGAAAAEAAGMRVVTVARDGGLIGGRPSVSRLDAGLMMSWMGLR